MHSKHAVHRVNGLRCSVFLRRRPPSRRRFRLRDGKLLLYGRPARFSNLGQVEDTHRYNAPAPFAVSDVQPHGPTDDLVPVAHLAIGIETVLGFVGAERNRWRLAEPVFARFDCSWFVSN